MDTENLKQQLEAFWATETGMPTPPGKIAEWLTAVKHPVMVFDAVRKTGTKVRSAAQDRPFVLGQAVAYCWNVIRSADDRRSRTTV